MTTAFPTQIDRLHLPATRSGGRAFTLVELLIVIAIIALLVAVLMPALSHSRASAQSSVCLTNLRRLGVANHIYLQTYEVFPPFRLSTFPAGGPVHVNGWGAAQPRWQWFLDQGIGPVIDPLGFPTPFGDNSVSITGRDGMTMTNRYFSDPALSDEGVVYNIRNGAYGYNYQYLGNSRADSQPGQFDNWPVSVTRITVPSNTILIADSRGGALPHGNHSYSLDPPQLAVSRRAARHGPNGTSSGEELGHSSIERRHLGRGNVVFVDTHAESGRLEDFGYELDSSGQVVADGPTANNAKWSGHGRDEP